MYTEENEFDYNDYEEENNDYQKKSFNKGLIIKIVVVLLCVILLIFLFFKIKNSFQNKDNGLLVFNNNVSMMREAGEIHFFQNKNLPSEVGKSSVITVKDLIANDLLTDIKDKNGDTCGYTASYVSLTKADSDYAMKVYLSCPSIENTVTYYYDLEGNCLTCNGEDYTPSDITLSDDNSNNTDDNDNNSNNEDNSNNNNQNNTTTCSTWSSWTTEYRDGAGLERETRTVVKGYKENPIYGIWSEWSKEEAVGNSSLQVETKTGIEETTSYPNEWKTSSEKPAEKEGREIDTVTSTKTKKTCSDVKTGETIWKEVAKLSEKGDAITCKIVSLGKYSCEYYVTEKKCTTKTYNVTTYKYRDAVKTQEEVTYYRFRTVTYGDPLYTDYILESEMPDGYTKVIGSEITQYRYREKCTK